MSILRKMLLGRKRWNSLEDQKKCVQDAQIILDVGANVGQSSEAYRRIYPNAKIFAFEPVPATFSRLKDRFKANTQIQPCQLAFGDAPGTATMYLSKGDQTNSMLPKKNRTGDTIEIRTDTVDNFCASNAISTVDILKVDVEGNEGRVFAGAAGLFQKKAVRLIFTEVYFYAVYEGMPLFWDLQKQLEGYGFKLYGLYSLARAQSGRLEFCNALYTLED